MKNSNIWHVLGQTTLADSHYDKRGPGQRKVAFPETEAGRGKPARYFPETPFFDHNLASRPGHFSATATSRQDGS
jgi:hypothetical protein